MEPRIERCTPEHSERLTEIAHASKRHWGYPERYIQLWRDGLTVPREMIREHQVRAEIVDGAIVGFYVLMEFGARAELEHMWVVPDWIGRGVGRRLLLDAIDLARRGGATVLDITSDPNAEGFYVSMGARRVDRVFSPIDGQERYLPRMELTL